MPRALRLVAPAKVNLVLAVGQRGADGFHEVGTVLQALRLQDRLVLARRDGPVRLWCDDARVGPPAQNLACRAAEALRRAAGLRVGAAVRLTKRIPTEAGLGGGSSDAAAVLLGCNRLWDLRWPPHRLLEVAAGLGSDVPFFLIGGTALGEHRGERITPLPPLPAWPVLLCHPGPGMATADAYRRLDQIPARRVTDIGPALAAIGSAPQPALAAAWLTNDFESAVLPARPDIAALRARLLAAGARAAMLCGSGAAVFALAPTAGWARTQALSLRADGLWAVATRFWPGRAGPWPRTEGG